MYYGYGYNGIFGILVLIADIWAIVNILQSGAQTDRKVLWTVLVVLLPALGSSLGRARTERKAPRPQAGCRVALARI